MRRLPALTAATLTLTLAGCWPAPGHDPNRSSYNDLDTAIDVTTVEDLELAWEQPLGWQNGQELFRERAGNPILSNAGLVTISTPSSLAAFEPATGTRRWLRGSSSDPGRDQDTFAHGDAVFGGYGRTSVLWNDAGTGAPASGNPYIGQAPALRGDVVASTWRYPGLDTLDANVELVVGSMADPASRWNGTLWYGRGGGLPVRPGITLAEDQVLYAGPGLRSSTPGDGTLVNALRSYPLTAVPEDCGPGYPADYACPTWISPPLDGTAATAPVLKPDGSAAYVGTDAGTLYSLATTVGSVNWSVAAGSAITAPPALAIGQLYVPTASGSLLAIDNSAGDRPWTSPPGDALTVQPAVAGGVVFTGDAGGTVAARDADTGALLWSDEMGSPITGAPIVTLDKLFVGTEDGRLVAYELGA